MEGRRFGFATTMGKRRGGGRNRSWASASPWEVTRLRARREGFDDEESRKQATPCYLASGGDRHDGVAEGRSVGSGVHVAPEGVDEVHRGLPLVRDGALAVVRGEQCEKHWDRPGQTPEGRAIVGA